jgi:hypothetical protein
MKEELLAAIRELRAALDGIEAVVEAWNPVLFDDIKLITAMEHLADVSSRAHTVFAKVHEERGEELEG